MADARLCARCSMCTVEDIHSFTLNFLASQALS